MKKEILIVFFISCFSSINSIDFMDKKKEEYTKKMNSTYKICCGLNFLNNIDTPIHRVKVVSLLFRAAITSFAFFASSNEDALEMINNGIR